MKGIKPLGVIRLSLLAIRLSLLVTPLLPPIPHGGYLTTYLNCVIVCFCGVLWANRGARVKSGGAKGGRGGWSGYPTKKT